MVVADCATMVALLTAREYEDEMALLERRVQYYAEYQTSRNVK